MQKSVARKNDWIRAIAPCGSTFYHNSITRLSQWSSPSTAAFQHGSSPESQSLSGWTSHIAADGSPFFFNQAVGLSQWMSPCDNTSDSNSISSLVADHDMSSLSVEEWEEIMDPEGVVFWYSREQRLSRRERPTEYT